MSPFYFNPAPNKKTDINQIIVELDNKMHLHRSHVVFIVSDFIDMARYQPDFVDTMNEISESGAQV